jgi:hypothetical protein
VRPKCSISRAPSTLGPPSLVRPVVAPSSGAPHPGLQPSPIAPEGRFGGVRSSLGNFARSGDDRDLRRSHGHYVRSGYGGSNIATRRFGGTAETAGSFGHALYSTASGAADAPVDAVALAGRSTEETANAIIEAVRPVDGTQDAEAGRAAMHDAMSELLTEHWAGRCHGAADRNVHRPQPARRRSHP